MLFSHKIFLLQENRVLCEWNWCGMHINVCADGIINLIIARRRDEDVQVQIEWRYHNKMTVLLQSQDN